MFANPANPFSHALTAGCALLLSAALGPRPAHASATDEAATARAYIEAVGEKRFERVAQFLTPDVEFSTPGGGKIQGATGYIAALRKLAPILVRNDVKRVFADGDEACIVYDFVTDTSAGPVPSVEWLRFRDGRISSVRLIFHSAPWPAVLQALSAKTAASPPAP